MKLTENTKVRVRVPKHLYEAIQAELAKKEEMEECEMGSKEEELEEWVGVNPDQDTLTLMLGLAIPVLTAIIAAGPKAVGQAAWNAAKAALSKKKKSGDTDKGDFLDFTKLRRSNESISEAPVQEAEEQELDEVLDIQTLMEAVKDATKKKAEEKKKKAEADKKKKEAEAKKKAEEKKKADEKKKKEAEAKKKADAKKK